MINVGADIGILGLHSRTESALRDDGVSNIAGILQMTRRQLELIPMFGAKSFQDLLEKMRDSGYVMVGDRFYPLQISLKINEAIKFLHEVGYLKQE